LGTNKSFDITNANKGIEKKEEKERRIAII